MKTSAEVVGDGHDVVLTLKPVEEWSLRPHLGECVPHERCAVLEPACGVDWHVIQVCKQRILGSHLGPQKVRQQSIEQPGSSLYYT